jgi:hypothetical protein
MVSGESPERRGNILRKVPVALWRIVCKCFVKSSLKQMFTSMIIDGKRYG